MDNYVSAELEVVNFVSADAISASVEVTPDENELPIDKSWST